MKYIKILSKYLFPLFVFFGIETIFHGQEIYPLILSILYTGYLYMTSKNLKVDSILFSTAFMLGILIEVGLTSFSRAQMWSNSNLFAVPMWLPLAWGIAGITFYMFGKELENNFKK